jgi:hypothetical protein
MYRIADAIVSGKIRAVDVLRRWHLYDDKGCDVAEAFRELGKVDRTEFLLEYARDKELQSLIRDGCNAAEMLNSFHEAIFWGNGGKLRSNDPLRQEESLLALTLLMFSIIFYNVERYGDLGPYSGTRKIPIPETVNIEGVYDGKRAEKGVKRTVNPVQGLYAWSMPG